MKYMIGEILQALKIPIRLFKMSFGGEIKTVYGCFIGNTLKGRILIKLRELKNKSKK